MATAKKATKKTAAKKTARKSAAKKVAAKTATSKLNVVEPTATDTPRALSKKDAQAVKADAIANATETKKTTNPKGSWPFPTGERP